jgi:hypothetical protein
MTNDEINCIVKFIEDCTKAGLITPPINDDAKIDYSDKLADEIFGESGVIQYSQRQETSQKIYFLFK